MENPPPPCLHKKFYLFTNAPPKHSPLASSVAAQGRAPVLARAGGLLRHCLLARVGVMLLGSTGASAAENRLWRKLLCFVLGVVRW